MELQKQEKQEQQKRLKKVKNKVVITILTMILAANAGYSMPASAHSVIVKFSLAMVGVLISTLLIFVGLTIYNKIRENYLSDLSPEEEVLKTPKTRDEAIRFFIRKNKI